MLHNFKRWPHIWKKDFNQISCIMKVLYQFILYITTHWQFHTFVVFNALTAKICVDVLLSNNNEHVLLDWMQPSATIFLVCIWNKMLNGFLVLHKFASVHKYHTITLRGTTIYKHSETLYLLYPKQTSKLVPIKY